MMNGAMRFLLGFVLLCCGFHAAFAAPQHAQRGALSPSAPVRLDYALPDTLPASGNLEIPLKLSTPIRSGRLLFEVVSSEGLSVSRGGNAGFNLDGANQPFAHDLQVLLGTETVRSVVVLVTVDGPMGSLSRSYRIDLSLPGAAPAVSTRPVLKLMPATQPR